MRLFDLDLDPLFWAIATVESQRGVMSRNIYQISDTYLNDCNRIMHLPGRRYFPPFKPADVFLRGRSECMMVVYWAYWGQHYKICQLRNPTLEVLARIHNGGPDGWKKPSTIAYWNRVQGLVNHNGGSGFDWVLPCSRTVNKGTEK